jgi:hypothetical protein
MKIHNVISNIVQLTLEDNEQYKEQMASLSLNKTIKWVKFILTDDQPNINKQRIPKGEFPNLVKSGIYMPIKMAQGYIREGHEYSVPIGTITNLIEREHSVEGIAALWSKEYPDEVKLLEGMSSAGEKPQISWEIMYLDSEKKDEIEEFKDVQLAAATVVSLPAYSGRTPILVVASKQTGGITSMDEKELQALKDSVAALTTDKNTLTENVATLTKQVADLTKERDELATFKAEADAKTEKETKLAAIKKVFADNEVEIPEEYFADEAKAAKLLSMSIEQIDYMIKELGIFAKKEESTEKASKHIGAKNIPNLKGEKPVLMTPREIAEKLREEAKKK